MDNINILSQVGLSKNESKIYETLLENGESSVAVIANKAEINRRNVYDSLSRLIEKGLIFEIREHNENLYQAVDPNKLMEMLKEKEKALESVLPGLYEKYSSKPHNESVFIYRGIEGWKNYLRDIIRVGEQVYTIGAKGGWGSGELESFMKWFWSEAGKKEIKFNFLFDCEVKEKNLEILKVKSNRRFLPKGHSAPAVIETFGDYVVIFPELPLGEINKKMSFTVIVNPYIAETFRTWFKLMWSISKE
ncbi:MAG: transcriptional regulator TrmB [Candidatus Nomurabacteria bacterium]|nr:transcriptional regulator TrmB [Candidatus Nomurabacteria bacterium]